MTKPYIIKGMIIGMKDLGANLVKTDDNFLYFTVKTGSTIDNEAYLQRAKEAFLNKLGLVIKIKRIP